MCILPFSLSNGDSSLCCAVDVCFQNWAQVLLVRIWFFFFINSYFSKILSFNPPFPGWVVNGGSVDFSITVEVMALWRLEPKGGIPTLVTVVDGASFSPVGPRVATILGLLVCSWNSSEDTSVTGEDKSCLGIFSFGTYSVVVGDTVAGGPCCSTSTNVLGSHTV